MAGERLESSARGNGGLQTESARNDVRRDYRKGSISVKDDGKATAEDVIRVLEHLGDDVNTDIVFGESRVMGEHVLIPVARVRYGGGGGAGGSTERSAETQREGTAGEGVGGGFGVSAVPVGAIDVTNERVVWSPLVDWNRLAMIWSVVAGLGILMMLSRAVLRRPSKRA